MIGSLIFFTLWLAAGCMTPARYGLAVAVSAGGQPVAGALVAMMCEASGMAQRADAAGRVRFAVVDAEAAGRCRVVAGKPGFSTAEARSLRACAAPEVCPVLALELEARAVAASGEAP